MKTVLWTEMENLEPAAQVSRGPAQSFWPSDRCVQFKLGEGRSFIVAHDRNLESKVLDDDIILMVYLISDYS